MTELTAFLVPLLKHARRGLLRVGINVFDRTKKPAVYCLAGRQYVAVAAQRDGWVTAETLGVRLRVAAGPRLALEDLADPQVCIEI